MPPSAAIPIEIEQDGRTYKGTYTIDATGDIITVTYRGKGKTTQLGGLASAPDSLARIMLQGLVARA